MVNETQRLAYWLLDTRSLWNGEKIVDTASDALNTLTSDEVAKAKRFYFLKDAKLSVASSLLKRLFASTIVGIPWSKAEFALAGNPKHGKPCVIVPKSSAGTNAHAVDFNVTHQAGLVALAGFRAQDPSKLKSVGVDVVCVNERNDLKGIKSAYDFHHWVDLHSEVFSLADVNAMKTPVLLDAQNTTKIEESNFDAWDLPRMMRKFYAFWALKEAYVKMEGEALLADWLQHVEFRCVKVPDAPPLVPGASEGDDSLAGKWGEPVLGIEAWLYGKKRDDVVMFLQAFEQDYMIATSFVKSSVLDEDGGSARVSAPKYQVFDLERDIMVHAN